MKYLITMIILLSTATPNIIVDFNKNSDIRNWFIVDDVVMGGRSSGSFDLNEEGHGVFYGEVSLENNGGFSSLRYRMREMPVSGYSKVVLKVKGDGKDYQFRVRADMRDRYSYTSSFSTSGKWQQIEIPLKDMYPVFRGRTLNMPNFSHDAIGEITFLIGNGKPESFKLVVDKIELR